MRRKPPSPREVVAYERKRVSSIFNTPSSSPSSSVTFYPVPPTLSDKHQPLRSSSYSSDSSLPLTFLFLPPPPPNPNPLRQKKRHHPHPPQKCITLHPPSPMLLVPEPPTASPRQQRRQPRLRLPGRRWSPANVESITLKTLSRRSKVQLLPPSQPPHNLVPHVELQARTTVAPHPA